MASGLVRSSLDRAVRVPTLARDIALCSWANHFTLSKLCWLQNYHELVRDKEVKFV